jgi:hypothetical protein
MHVLASQTMATQKRVENEQTLLLAIRAKLDTTLAKLTQCHQEAIRLQSNTDARFHLMINTAKGRLEQIDRLKAKMIRYENSLDIASPISEDVDVLLSQSDDSTTHKFQVHTRIVNELIHLMFTLSRMN